MGKVLSRDFYAGNDPVSIAKSLLGKVLVAEKNGIRTSGIIVETEAYKAPEDLACHARGNKKTPRTLTMFGPPGHAYIYICYGLHHLFNVITGDEGRAHAILVRAIEPLENLAGMRKRRAIKASDPHLVNGPGKLTVALGINKNWDAVDLTDTNGGLYIENSDIKFLPKDIFAGPRVGMSPLTESSGHLPWRFYVKQNKYVSKPLHIKYDW